MGIRLNLSVIAGVCTASTLVVLGQNHPGATDAISHLAVDGDPFLSDHQVGIVRDTDGQPVAGASVQLVSLKRRYTVHTDKDGRYRLPVPTGLVGKAWLFARTADDTFHAYVPFPQVGIRSPVDLQLLPTSTISVRVNNDVGEPLENSLVVADVHFYQLLTAHTDARGFTAFRALKSELRSVAAFRNGLGMDYRMFRNDESVADPVVELTLTGAQPLKVSLVDHRGYGISGAVIRPPNGVALPGRPWYELPHLMEDLSVRTDAQGVAVFPWFPKGARPTVVNEFGLGPKELMIIGGRHELDGDEQEYIIDRPVPLRGQVTLPSGAPAQGIRLAIAGIPERTWESLVSKNGHVIDGVFLLRDGFRSSLAYEETDAEGRFNARVLPHHTYMVAIRDATWAAPAELGVSVRPETPINDCSFRLQPIAQLTTRVYGRVSRADDGSPLQHIPVSIRHLGTLVRPADDATLQRPSIQSTTTTNDKGEFEFQVEPGEYEIECVSDISYVITDFKPSTYLKHFRVQRDEPQQIDFRVKVWPVQDSTR